VPFSDPHGMALASALCHRAQALLVSLYPFMSSCAADHELESARAPLACRAISANSATVSSSLTAARSASRSRSGVRDSAG
jgi:hypothetical protein